MNSYGDVVPTTSHLFGGSWVQKCLAHGPLERVDSRCSFRKLYHLHPPNDAFDFSMFQVFDLLHIYPMLHGIPMLPTAKGRRLPFLPILRPARFFSWEVW